MANETALLELVNVIGEAKDKGLWDQSSWAAETPCGTACCAAGWKATLDGKQMMFYKVGEQMIADNLTTGQSIEEYATEALELTAAEAGHLFWNTYDNNYGDFVVRVKEVINGEIG